MFNLFNFGDLFSLADKVEDLPSCDGFPMPCYIQADGTCQCGGSN